GLLSDRLSLASRPPELDRRHHHVGHRSPPCCGSVRKVCCDVSAPSAAASSPAPLPPPKPAIACASGATPLASPMDALDAVGGSGAKRPRCQSNPTAPRLAADVIMLLAMS